MQRTFIPGSQWLYFKIYTGQKTADEMLARIIDPYVETLYSGKLIDNFFFIRYSDPDFHIRLRLHVIDDRSYAEIFREFTSRFQAEVDNGNIVKIMCDTYVREIERYGDETMELVEKIFCIDSLAITKLLGCISELPAANREVIRWQTVLLLLDDTLTAFDNGLTDKLRITQLMADSYKREFGFTSHAYTKQLNDKYRAERKAVEQLLSTRNGAEQFFDILAHRRKQINEIAQTIERVHASSPKEGVRGDDLLFSIQHMTMNRWFRAQQRMHELVIYDFMCKFYESALVRNRVKQEAPENLKE